jgi:hypothetical protein
MLGKGSARMAEVKGLSARVPMRWTQSVPPFCRGGGFLQWNQLRTRTVAGFGSRGSARQRRCAVSDPCLDAGQREGHVR